MTTQRKKPTVTTRARRRRPTAFQHWLKVWGACSLARRWVGGKTVQRAWENCPDASWMQWLLVRSRTKGQGWWVKYSDDPRRLRQSCPRMTLKDLCPPVIVHGNKKATR